MLSPLLRPSSLPTLSAGLALPTMGVAGYCRRVGALSWKRTDLLPGAGVPGMNWSRSLSEGFSKSESFLVR